MFVATITGNLGRNPERTAMPYDAVKVSMALSIGNGDKKQTVWIGASIGHKRGQHLLKAKKGQRITAVIEITGYSQREEYVNLWGKILDFSIHESIKQSDNDANIERIEYGWHASKIRGFDESNIGGYYNHSPEEDFF